MYKITREMGASLIEEFMRDISQEFVDKECDQINEENPDMMNLFIGVYEDMPEMVPKDYVFTQNILLYKIFKKAFEIHVLETT
jgi:hypothetical protein